MLVNRVLFAFSSSSANHIDALSEKSHGSTLFSGFSTYADWKYGKIWTVYQEFLHESSWRALTRGCNNGSMPPGWQRLEFNVHYIHYNGRQQFSQCSDGCTPDHQTLKSTQTNATEKHKALKGVLKEKFSVIHSGKFNEVSQTMGETWGQNLR